MPRNRTVIIVVVVVAVILLCVCGVVGAYALWNTPLGPSLAYPTQGVVPISETWPIAPTAEIPGSEPTMTAEPPVAAHNCGNTGFQNILVLGVDAPSGGTFGPLVISILKVDFSNKSMNVFSFPRDLWLTVYGLESLGYSQARLGEAYQIARTNGGLPVSSATNQLALNLNNNFGAQSHHYITVKITTLSTLIDTVGGITVNIRTTYDGTPYGFHYFAAGPYYMNGELALEYALSPSNSEQWNGADRKVEVFVALFQKMSSAEIIPQIPNLLTIFLQTVTTDLSMQQVTDLVCIAQQIPVSQIQFAGVEPADVTFGTGGILYPNVDAIRGKVTQYLS